MVKPDAGSNWVLGVYFLSYLLNIKTNTLDFSASLSLFEHYCMFDAL